MLKIETVNAWESPLHMIRLYVKNALYKGHLASINEQQTHYLAHVMRVRDGDEILLFNGSDGEWLAKINYSKKQLPALTCLQQTREQSTSPELRLFFAPIKRGHGDAVIEKATELGATRLSPVLTQHTIVSRVPLERYEAIAIEAAEQCERLTVPLIDPPQKLTDAINGIPKDQTLILCAEQGKAESFAEVVMKLKQPLAGIMVGPEGGFSKEEFALFNSCSFVWPAHLGNQILRADTAALAALALYQSASGNWNNRV